jgi:transmembrane sensor
MKHPNDLKRYQDLATKWLNKTITPAEEKEFAEWYNSNQDAPLNIPADFALDEDAHKARIYSKINEAIKSSPKTKRIFPLYLRYAAAAVVLALVSVTAFRMLHKIKREQLATINAKKHLKNDVLPGSSKAVLTLSNGSQIVLNNAKNGILASQGKTLLNKSNGNVLVYEAPKTTANAPQKIEYNTISTPKGGQFQIILPDGSKALLNAASSIRFPTLFTGSERKVTITGEVYFEVTKNKAMPFRVISGRQTVEVLGTHFDVSAYTDESHIKTTLAEGSVKIYTGGNTALLKPNQQACIANTGNEPIKIKEVDTEEALAWTNGVFEFESADIALIMRQAARWYDVSIDYAGQLPAKRFTGSISRNVNLSELLNMLKYTGVNFKIQDKTIVVTP